MENSSVWKDISKEKGIIKPLPQRPKTRKSIVRDASRHARTPGERISKNGKKYWETRQNRSDIFKSNL